MAGELRIGRSQETAVDTAAFLCAPHVKGTLLEVLRARADEAPRERALTYLVDGDSQELHLTYGALDARARAVAATLQRVTAAGERVLLLYPAGPDFIVAFLGCLYAGAVAVPACPPRPGRAFTGVQAIIRDAQARTVLTTSSLLPAFADALHGVRPSERLRFLATDGVALESATEWRGPGIDQRTLAYLQYTSGSTALPKGVMITHGNLVNNLAVIRAVDTRHSAAVTWLPHFHDMGLVAGLLQPLYAGFPVVVMSPIAFAQRPVRWLNAISRYGATFSGAPNSAYDLCARKVTPEQETALDLSRWRVAFNGSEPIFSDTLDRFATRFAHLGFQRAAFYPTYGLAEATLMVSGGKGLTPPAVLTVSTQALAGNRAQLARPGDAGSRTFVGCGERQPGHIVRIINPETCVSCASGDIGEIWVAGPSVSPGYWHQSHASRDTFRAFQRDTGDGPFLRTGDLGFMHGGELFITGRLRDLVIIGGRNHHPHDIERTIQQSHSGLRACAAFSVEHGIDEQLVIAIEPQRQYARPSRLRRPDRAERTGADLSVMASSVRHVVWEEHEVPEHDVVFVPIGTMPLTTSGKVKRRACREAYADGTLARIGY